MAKDLGVKIKTAGAWQSALSRFARKPPSTAEMQPRSYEYPKEVHRWPRCKDSNPFVTERSRVLYVGGREIANGFSELN